MGDLEAAVCIALETESHAASGGFQGEPLDHPLPAPGQLLYARPFATFANHHQVWVNGEPRWCAECAVEACAISLMFPGPEVIVRSTCRLSTEPSSGPHRRLAPPVVCGGVADPKWVEQPRTALATLTRLG